MALYECVVHAMHVCKKLKSVEFEKFSIQQTMDMHMSTLNKKEEGSSLLFLFIYFLPEASINVS